MPAWRSWYHVTGHTYGTWNPGDERGWKTRHGRPQPGSDGQCPPTPSGFRRYQRHVAKVMLREPVTLSSPARRMALDTIVAALDFHEIETVVVAVTAQHFHMLARFQDDRPRKWAGIAKKESARALSTAGLAAEGGVWAVRSHCDPIKDREHQLAVTKYIADHELEGGVVWAIWRENRSQCPAS